MGQKSPKGGITITNDNNRIRLRWKYQGKRYSLNLSHYKKENLIKAKQTALDIERDIFNDCFDVSLNRYKGSQVIVAEVKAPKKEMISLFEEWVTNYRNKNCETDIDYHSVRQMMKRWKHFSESDVLTRFSKEDISPRTYNRRLTLLKKFFSWTTKIGQTTINPLDDVCQRKAGKVVNESRLPFSIEEIRKLLKAFKEDTYCPKSSRYKHSHYYSFLYFILATGVRNAEAIGLRVSHVKLEEKKVLICETLARSIRGTNAAARVRKCTKNEKERFIPVSDDLSSILRECMTNKKVDDLVFKSPSGLAIDDKMFQRRVLRPVLKALDIPKRDLYACRHTFGSRCIEAGITPVMTAFLMGNNPETALRNYTHLIEMPKNIPTIKEDSLQGR
jgi:integrase